MGKQLQEVTETINEAMGLIDAMVEGGANPVHVANALTTIDLMLEHREILVTLRRFRHITDDDLWQLIEETP